MSYDLSFHAAGRHVMDDLERKERQRISREGAEQTQKIIDELTEKYFAEYWEEHARWTSHPGKEISSMDLAKAFFQAAVVVALDAGAGRKE
jgi:hypothetical protein